jgi:hypothetical protein
MKKMLTVFILLFALAAAGSFSHAQDATKVYTQVGLWDVPRAQWADFQAYYEKYELPVLEKMLADGVIVEFGFDADGLHQAQGYSHSTWFIARSLGNLEAVLKAYSQSLGPEAAAREAEFAAMISRHEDFVTEALFYRSTSANLTSGHAVGNGVRVKRGRMSDFRQAWESWSKPVYDQLVADGTIVAYILDTPYFHTSEESLGSVWTWYILRDLSDQHKVDAAFDSARDKLSPVDRSSRRLLYWDTIEEGSHRDGMSRLIHYQSKGQ